MARQLLTRGQIKAEMQRKIQESTDLDGDCRECRAPGVQPLREADESGCNWIPGHYGGPPECAEVISRIVREARAKYNVID
jgi:hypothetical protein